MLIYLRACTSVQSRALKFKAAPVVGIEESQYRIKF